MTTVFSRTYGVGSAANAAAIRVIWVRPMARAFWKMFIGLNLV